MLTVAIALRQIDAGVGVESEAGAVHSDPSSKRAARTEHAPGWAAIRQAMTAPGENVPIFVKSVSPIRITTIFAVFVVVFTNETSNPTT